MGEIVLVGTLIVIAMGIYGLIDDSKKRAARRIAEEIKRKQEEEFRRRNENEAVVFGEHIARLYADVSLLVGSKYPQIRIAFPDEADFVSRVREGGRQVAIDAVFRNFVQCYREFEPVFQTAKEIPRALASQEFWTDEVKWRVTSDGISPPDWSVRRRLVWLRDDKRCQRCGRMLENGQSFHAHHIKWRAAGGDHSLENLVTLCPDCHALMEGHESMMAVRPYCVSKAGVVHVPDCRHAKGLTPVYTALPKLWRAGKRACKLCDPWEVHEGEKDDWVSEFESDLMDVNESFLAFLAQIGTTE